MATITPSELLTAEAYGELPDLGRPTELVRGRIVEMNVPYPRHGQVCARISHLLQCYLDTNDIGHVLINDAGVILERNPDTVRGPDVTFISYEKAPKGRLPKKYFEVAPELVFEVRSPSDRWGRIFQRVGDFLTAGTQVVCVVDPESEAVQLHFADRPTETLRLSDTLSFPALLPGFSTSVSAIFQ
jgi:Uma2 family endonuclease